MTLPRLSSILAISAVGALLGACAPGEMAPTTGSGGASASGGASQTGSGGAATGGATPAGSGGASNSTGGATATGGARATGGATSGGSSGASGGRSGSSGGASVGQTGGATGTGGAAGRAGGAGGRVGTGGSTGAAGAGAAIPLKNAPVSSAGCGKAAAVTNGKKTIMSSGEARTYIIDIPTNYDMNKPYRLFYTSHWIGSTSEAVRDQNYYFLKPLATAANEPAIFVAPQSQGSTWQQKDHALFDDILAYVKQSLCIDTTRVFATGFSFGGMITYSLSVNHQKDIRAAVGIAPANYNIYVPTKNRQPIAWMQTTGMSDTTCPWVQGSSATNGAKYIAIEHATDNGCMVPTTIPVWSSGKHVCYTFQGCRTEFPTIACTFGGGHTNIANDPNTNANWIPTESWAFFTQF